jgi:methylase of polypeptide subunit release factors
MSPERGNALRSYFREVGYTWNGVHERLGIWSPPTDRGSVYERTAGLLEGSTPFQILGKLFLLHLPVSKRSFASALPEEVRETLLDARLLRLEDEIVRPSAVLVPFGRLWIASDPPLHDPGASDSGPHVLGVNPVAQALLRFTRRDRAGKTLDLGAGNGIQGLAAAQHSGHVWMTDINERAAEYARFNAALNGIENVTVAVGNTFAPVDGLSFDLIVCNPPFILTPSHKLICYDNEQDLDGFCREIIRRAPTYLEDSGCLQMIFEWAEVEGEPWQSRLADWTADLGCDVWIYLANTRSPESYIDMRRDEMRLVAPEDVPPVKEWRSYFRERGVRAIHGGLLLLRKSTAPERVRRMRIEELAGAIDEHASAAVSSMLRRGDFLEEHRGALAQQRLEINPRARLKQESARSDGRWKPSRTTLEIPVGLPVAQGMDAQTAEFLVAFDGRSTVRERIEALAAQLGRTASEVEPGCLELVERLLERGFLVPA